jgi:hypothetical protein
VRPRRIVKAFLVAARRESAFELFSPLVGLSGDGLGVPLPRPFALGGEPGIAWIRPGVFDRLAGLPDVREPSIERLNRKRADLLAARSPRDDHGGDVVEGGAAEADGMHGRSGLGHPDRQQLLLHLVPTSGTGGG